MREQPTAQYGHSEWTSLAPAIRRSSARFFAGARSNPRGFARGTSAMPAVPAAPSFRNSRRVSSGIGIGSRFTPAFPAAQARRYGSRPMNEFFESLGKRWTKAAERRGDKIEQHELDAKV